MFNNKVRFLRRLVSSILCAGLLFIPISSIYAEGETQGESYEEYSDPTPTPDPHTAAYYLSADTDFISGWPFGPNIEAEAAVLMDVHTGSVLYSKNAEAAFYPASITKIMTALLGCENLDPAATLAVSQASAYGIEAGSSSIYADTGEEFTVDQALMAVMLESANEMSLAIGEETCGSVKKFVELMNERARQLGCTNTHFNNPNGLPDEIHYTSAHDMARIAQAAYLNPRFRRLVTTQYYEIPPTNVMQETRYMRNHHQMMSGRDYAYDGVVGGKTGYTTVAGSTLVTFAEKGNTTLVAVVLKTIGGGYSDTAALLDYGFNQFEKNSVAKAGNSTSYKALPGEKYLLKDLAHASPFYYIQDAYVTVPKGTDINGLTKERTLLPAAAGPARLYTQYYYNGHPVGYSEQYEKEILSDLLL